MVSLWPLVALFPLAFGTETCDASARPFKMRVKDDFFSPEEVAQLIAAFGTLELLPCPAGGWASRSVPLKVAGLATWIDGMDRSSYHVPAPAALAERFAAEVGASVLPRNLFIRPGSLEDAHIDEAAETLLVFLTEGAVFLPAANETVTGRAGRLVAWSNVLPDGRADTRAMHRGIDPPTGGKLVVHMGWNGDDWMCACPCVYLILLFSGRFFFIFMGGFVFLCWLVYKCRKMYMHKSWTPPPQSAPAVFCDVFTGTVSGGFTVFCAGTILFSPPATSLPLPQAGNQPLAMLVQLSGLVLMVAGCLLACYAGYRKQQIDIPQN